MRHAIYYTPEPDSLLHGLASAWLGRHAISGAMTAGRPDDRLEDLTRDPSRYGFHGTLKPPFRLKDGTTVQALENAVQRLASQHDSFVTPPLVVTFIDGFLALVPDGESAALDDLAADCVQKLDDFRLPPPDSELARRRAAGLTAREEENLARWGYPYVLEDFRFHLTLTGRLQTTERDWVMEFARQHFAPVLGSPLSVQSLTMMTEPEDGAPFLQHARLPLVSASTRTA